MLAPMRASRFFSPTLREDPADADIVSHRLLLRAGYIRRVTSGVYDFLPLGLRVLRRIEKVVREEMDAVGAQEILMPMVQPAELWQQSGRWRKYGPELLRFKDRHGHDSCLGPTHEEVVCDLVRRELRSYKQLPLTLYQIQSKFRDEVRPRYGLMRGREFIMKDAYSFHADDEDLQREYRRMYDAYSRIFTRLGLKFRAVEADTGAIGGHTSHEFHVLAASGEDLIAHCSGCDYAANVEKARTLRDTPSGECAALAEVETPDVTAAEEVAAFLGMAPALLVKTLLYRIHGGDSDGKIVAACIRGDDQLQEVKLKHAVDADDLALATEDEIRSVGGVAGFAGPLGLRCRVIVDDTLKGASGLAAGANKKDRHIRGLDMERDLPHAVYADLRQTRAGDRCRHCGAPVALSHGIEVGQVFSLGRRYTEPMDVCFQAKNGRRIPATMGCYGIGISRLVAAVVEQCHDETGIAWPMHLAPFHAVLISIGDTERVTQASRRLYEALQEAGVQVLWDDRNERPGVKFRDAELIGIPLRIVVGERSLAQGGAEVCGRREEKRILDVEEVAACLGERIRTDGA